MSYKCDLKNLSLQLFGKEVEITLTRNSASHVSHDTVTLKGILAGRIWGKAAMADGEYEDHVIALTLRLKDNEIEIPCKDIDFLKELYK